MRNPFKLLSVIVYEPEWLKNKNVDGKYPLKYGESVLFLGMIPNVRDHCAVVKHSGEVVWLMHPSDFRKAKESEL